MSAPTEDRVFDLLKCGLLVGLVATYAALVVGCVVVIFKTIAGVGHVG